MVRALPLMLLLAMLVAPPAAAQTMETLSPEERRAMMAQQARQGMMDRLLSGTLALEGAIDPDHYIVGPGDVFSIAVGGALATENPARVTADGQLVIPEVGSFQVAGLTLAETRSRVQTGLRRIYRNVETQVALAQPRQFFVHVSGAVTRPGRHVMIPIGRVEDAVSAGMEGESPLAVYRNVLQPWLIESPLPSLRNVVVQRSDGSVTNVDLLSYYATGNREHNPYLLDGDAVFVPTFDRRGSRTISIEREVLRSAAPSNRKLYDYREDDTLTRLLLLDGGNTLLNETNSVRLVRLDESGQVRSQNVDVAAIRGGGCARRCTASSRSHPGSLESGTTGGGIRRRLCRTPGFIPDRARQDDSSGVDRGCGWS